MRVRRLLPVLLLALVLAVPSPAHAGKKKRNPYECGGAWRDTGACTFLSRGGGFGLSGWAQGDGVTWVSVRITAQGPAGTSRVIWACAAPGVTISGCGAVGVSSDEDSPVPPGTVLTCQVRGAPAGRYSCSG